jgi:hypothetical protein
VTGVGSASIVPNGPAGNQKLSILNTNIDFDIRSANVRMENLVRILYSQWLIAQLVECSLSVMKDPGSNLGADICSFCY